MKYDLIVVGSSAGGIASLRKLLSDLKNPHGVPIIILQHISPRGETFLPAILENVTGVPTKEAEDKLQVETGYIYTPAPNYHLLLEKDMSLSLTIEERVSFARPSIDVFFESVADACKNKVISILLTGANHDGAAGMMKLHEEGSYTMVQDPLDAYSDAMPRAALKLFKPEFVGTIENIKEQLEVMIN